MKCEWDSESFIGTASVRVAIVARGGSKFRFRIVRGSCGFVGRRRLVGCRELLKYA